MGNLIKLVLKVSAALAALALVLAAGYVAVNWHSDVPVAELAERWAPPPSVFITLDGMQVHMQDDGPRDDPRPIVLLHGTSDSLQTWDGWSEVLVARHRVIRLDLPAFGLTGPFPDADYRTAHYVSFLSDFLNRLGILHCVVGGNSFGGELAWQLAAAEPKRVDALILVDSAGYAFRSTATPIGFELARVPLVNRLLEGLLPRSVVRASVRSVYGDPARVTDALVERYFELTLRSGNRRALVQHFAVYHPGEDAARIASLHLPTLVLWGGRDHLIPPENGERFAHDIAGAKLLVFDALGHVPHEEDPQATVKPVEAFLDALPAPSLAAASP